MKSLASFFAKANFSNVEELSFCVSRMASKTSTSFLEKKAHGSACKKTIRGRYEKGWGAAKTAACGSMAYKQKLHQQVEEVLFQFQFSFHIKMIFKAF